MLSNVPLDLVSKLFLCAIHLSVWCRRNASLTLQIISLVYFISDFLMRPSIPLKDERKIHLSSKNTRRDRYACLYFAFSFKKTLFLKVSKFSNDKKQISQQLIVCVLDRICYLCWHCWSSLSMSNMQYRMTFHCVALLHVLRHILNVHWCKYNSLNCKEKQT